MRIIFAIPLVTLLSVATVSLAATVAYQDPYLTIVATEEPLQSVLKSLGREMRISVTTPTGLNPPVSCTIEMQPVKQAFKILLGEMSYTLKWDENSGDLVGLTILGSDTGVAAAPAYPSARASANTVASLPAYSGGQPDFGTPADLSDHLSAMPEQKPPMDAGHEARMAVEGEAHEAEREQQRQKEEIAHEARMMEEVQRHDDEMRAYIESQGLTMPQ